MFRNSYQNGLLSIFYSCGNRPLKLWSKSVKNGYVKRITDEQVKSLVLELVGNNVVSTYIACPADMSETLGIKMPFLILIVKNLKKYFTFEIQVLDDKQMKRKFTVSNAATTTRIRNFDSTLPINLNPGWNQIQLNLAEITKKAYGTNFVECTRIHVHANCRLQRIFFADKAYADEDLPKDYKLFVNDSATYNKVNPNRPQELSGKIRSVTWGGRWIVNISNSYKAPIYNFGGFSVIQRCEFKLMETSSPGWKVQAKNR